jgi:hypothetical protein
MPSIPFHPPGVTYNGLHGTPNPTAALVTADLATTKQHFGHVRTYYPQYGGGAVDVGKIAKDANLALLLGLFLFDGHPDWIAGNYEQFVKPAVARGNIAGILIGNEDPQMIDTVTQYMSRAKGTSRRFPSVRRRPPDSGSPTGARRPCSRSLISSAPTSTRLGTGAMRMPTTSR